MTNEAEVRRRSEKEATQAFLKQSELEQATAVGLGGPPQLRRWERSQFLGQFPEQVLWAATEEVLSRRPMPQELSKALADSRCQRIFVKASQIHHCRLILQTAKQHGLPVTVVHSPEFRNDVALVITTTEPHSQEEVFIEPRG
mgnify:CR=1 FL=1